MTTDHKVEGSNPSGRANERVSYFPRCKRKMKKVFLYVIGLLFLFFTVNFGLWFWHTSVIKEALDSLRTEFSNNGFVLSYDDITFKNLKSWRVEGRVINLYFKRKQSDGAVLTFPQIKFKSMPFDRKIHINFLENIVYDKDISIKPVGASPEIILDLEKSLSDAIEILRDPSLPKLGLIDNITYTSGPLQVLSKDLQVMASISESTIKTNSIRNEKESSFRIKTTPIVVEFSKEYNSPVETKKLLDLQSSVGKTTFQLEMLYYLKPSQIMLDMMEKNKDIKPLLDACQIEVVKLSQENERYGISLSGSFDKQPNKFLPEMDMKVDVVNYPSMVNYVWDVNNALVEMSFPGESYLLLNASQKNKMLEIFNDLHPEGNNIHISIKSDDAHGFLVSGKPFIDVLKALQDILLFKE